MKIFHRLTKHIDVLENYIRYVCYDVLSPDIYKIQHDTHCETTEQKEGRLLKSVCGAVLKLPTDIASLIFNLGARWS